jgi:pyruvate dehydrogenase phosphatase
MEANQKLLMIAKGLCLFTHLLIIYHRYVLNAFLFSFVPLHDKLCFSGFASEQKCMSADVIRKAFQATEEGFVSVVSSQWSFSPQLAAVGSCCLVGVVCSGTLYVANLGDSRAVLGRLVKGTGEVLAMQLSAEHNASYEEVRRELQASHPDDPHVVILKHNAWRVKGIIQVKDSL